VRVPGWGVHRGTLLQTLLDAVRAEGVPLETGVTVTAVRPDDRGVVVRTDTAGDRSFDLVIGADGAASVVRRESGLARHDRVYPYGALWAVVDDPEQRGGAALYQRYHGTRHYLGTLPTGLGRSSVFWSIRERDIDSAMTEGVDAWREQARPFAGEHDYLLDRVTHLLPARYRHVGCRQPDRHHPHRDAGVVLLGDAAHGMSPQLGAGGSLALADAWTLAAMLRRHDSVTAALTAYRSQRRAHIRWLAYPFNRSSAGRRLARVVRPAGAPGSAGSHECSVAPRGPNRCGTMPGVHPWTRIVHSGTRTNQHSGYSG